MIRIQTSQLAVLPGNIRGNFENILKEIKAAEENGADLLLLPELCLSGSVIGDLWEQSAFLRECEYYGRKIAEAAENIIVLFGNIAVDRSKRNEDGSLRKYNALFIASKGTFLSNGKLPYIIKTLLPAYRQFDDKRYFTDSLVWAREEQISPCDLFSPFSFSIRGEHFKVGILLGEDSFDEDFFISPMKILSEKQTDIIFNPASSLFCLEKKEKYHHLFSNASAKFHCPIIYVNRRGFENNGKNCYVYDGMTAAYDKEGNLLSEAESYQEKRSLFSFDPDAKQIIPEKPSVPHSADELLPALRYGIKEFLSAIHTEKVVIGISGGIDSAVNAALYRSVLPRENLLLVNTPTQFNSEITKNLAKKLADNLESPFLQIPIGNFIDATVESLDGLKIMSPGKEQTLHISGLMKENMQARDRSSRILSALSASFGGIFTCNANKTELSIGYGTLYGDLAGALAATGDLWKHQIYELGRELNHFYGSKIIPDENFSIKPSAELSENQDINKGLGDPLIYEYHDFLFRSFIEPKERLTPEDILLLYSQSRLEETIGTKVKINEIFKTPFDFISDLEKWWNLFSGFAVAKRIQSPPLLALSQRPFGNDLRESQMSPYYTDTYLQLKNKLISK